MLGKLGLKQLTFRRELAAKAGEEKVLTWDKLLSMGRMCLCLRSAGGSRAVSGPRETRLSQGLPWSPSPLPGRDPLCLEQ